MKCPVCNAEADKAASFCKHCGAKLPRIESSDESVKPAAAASVPTGEPLDPPAPGTKVFSGRRRGIADVPEETLWEGSYSPKAMLGPFVAGGVATIAIFVVGGMYGYWFWPFVVVLLLWAILLVRLALRRIGVSYRLTNKMFYHRRGVLTRTVDRIEAIDIDDVTWKQGIFERLVNVGSVKITSSDRTDPTFWAPGIENVEEVSRLIDEARRAERLRRAVSVEAV